MTLSMLRGFATAFPSSQDPLEHQPGMESLPYGCVGASTQCNLAISRPRTRERGVTDGEAGPMSFGDPRVDRNHA